MAEESKEKPPSQQKSSEEEKKPALVAPLRPAAPTVPAAARPAAVPPRPTMPAPAPAPRAPLPQSSSRRTFIKAAFAVGAVLTIVPFVPWESFLTNSLTSAKGYPKQKVVIDDVGAYQTASGLYKAAAGKPVNVNDLATFPPSVPNPLSAADPNFLKWGHWVFTYPSSGDLSIDSQSPDTFSKWELIRLPSGSPYNGEKPSAASFVAFSKVCVHLWCSPNFIPTPTNDKYNCPCHGSIYGIPNGIAVAGPAYVQGQQSPPTGVIPMLTLTVDSSGDLYAEVHNGGFDVNYNGVIGFGRNPDSYLNYILPAAEGSGKP